MMLSSASVTRAFPANLRPLDQRHDFPGVVDLIALGFSGEMDPLGLKLLSQMQKRARYGLWSQLLWGGPPNLDGFVWEEQGRVVGNLSLRRAHPRWNAGCIIGNVVVHPDFQGRGIARALMQAAEETARAEGARWIGLEVRADNVAASTLYTHLGFRAIGEVEHLLRPGDLPWPACPAPRAVWRRSRLQDRLLWAGLAEKTMSRLQAQVLEVRPEIYAYSSFEHALNLWFRREREVAWIHESLDPQMAASVQTDMARRFHLWELLTWPKTDDSRAQEVVARAVASTPNQRCWPIITFVDSRAALGGVLRDLGFVQHRLLTQMILDLH